MRVAVISDIHGNRPALEAVLRGADAGTATTGSLLDDEKMDDSAGSGALGMVACEGTVPGAGP